MELPCATYYFVSSDHTGLFVLCLISLTKDALRPFLKLLSGNRKKADYRPLAESPTIEDISTKHNNFKYLRIFQSFDGYKIFTLFIIHKYLYDSLHFFAPSDTYPIKIIIMFMPSINSAPT